MSNIIAFNHIFKNAGSTVSWALKNCFGERFFDYHELIKRDVKSVEDLPAMLSANKDLAGFEVHHFFYGRLTVPDYTLHDILLLRNPLARMRSNYDFLRSKPDGQLLGPYANKMDFKEFLVFLMREWGRGHADSQQVALLAHDGTPKIGGKKPAQEQLDVAISVVQEVAAIGTVERFDEAMVLAEAALQPLFPDIDLSYIKQNVTKSSKRTLVRDSQDLFRESLGEAVFDEFMERNAMDYAVLEMANKVMDERIVALPDFSTRLAAFEGRCKSKQ